MNILICAALLGLFFFVVLYLGFRTGLRLGMQTAKGQIPPKIKTPVEVVKEAIDEAKQDKQVNSLLADHQRMMDYDGFLPEERR